MMSRALVVVLLIAAIRGEARAEVPTGSRSLPRRPSANHTTHRGYVFVEGVYLSPPYVVETSGDAVLINNRPVYEPGALPPAATAAVMARQLLEFLEQDQALVGLPGTRPIPLNHDASGELIALLLNREAIADFDYLFEVLPPFVDRNRWSGWIRTCVVPTDLRMRREEWRPPVPIHRESPQETTRRPIAGSYLMSVAGLSLTVVAFGHLLTSRPQQDGVVSPELMRGAVVSIALVLGFSGLDLTWTLVNGAAGTMRELNPIAQPLMNRPLALVACKVFATLLGCGLLFTLRNRHIGRLACWWMCLVCTIVTLRWTVFHSLISS